MTNFSYILVSNVTFMILISIDYIAETEVWHHIFFPQGKTHNYSHSYLTIGLDKGTKYVQIRLFKTLRKHAYSNILKISPPETESFQVKILIFFHISAQNIDCGYSLEPPRRGGSNEYPQSMFLSRNKKNNVYPSKPQFYYIKVGFKGVKIIRYVFVMMGQNWALMHILLYLPPSSFFKRNQL